MLPEVLSNNLCSLNPNTDKLSITVKMIIGKNGNVKEYWVIETNSLNANGKYISDDVLLDRIQIPYWRAHPEESMAAYERRAVIHWDVTKGNSLW